MAYCDDSPAKKVTKKKKVNEPTECIIHVVKIGTKECINRFTSYSWKVRAPKKPHKIHLI